MLPARLYLLSQATPLSRLAFTMNGRASERSVSNASEIGGQAVWSLSSCKPGFGIMQLRDGSDETYWQSDGPQPHLINIEFLRKTAVQQISVFVDYKQDESYTPSKLQVKSGSHFHDLTPVTTVELEEPNGWVNIDVVDKDGQPLKGFLFQVSVLANHQNGRDTHIRQVKVFEPKVLPRGKDTFGSIQFESVDFNAMQTCR